MNTSAEIFDPATDSATSNAYARQTARLETEKASANDTPQCGNAASNPQLPALRPLSVAKLEKVLPYRPDMLPGALRRWLEDVAERGQFHFDFLAVAVMAALGSVVGRRCAVYPKQKDDWHEYPNLWAAIIGRPGAMKSPALSVVQSPLRAIEKSWADQFSADEKEYEATAVRAKIERKAALATADKAAKKGQSFELPEDVDLAPPICRRMLTSDPTEAKLGELLSQNPDGLTLELDELAVLIAMFEREPSMRDFLLKGWNGKEAHTVDRIVRGTVRIPAICLSVVGGIQPGRIAPIVKAAGQGAGGDGLLQRFQLVAWPDSWEAPWRNVDRWPDHEARKAANELFARLAHMKPDDFPDASDYGPRGLRFTPEAQEIFNDWHACQQNTLRSGTLSETLEAALSKSVKLVVGVALLCELADYPLSRAIGVESLNRGLEWLRVSESHTRRLYACAEIAEVDAARLIWQKIKGGKLTDGFTAREIKRAAWKGLTDGPIVEEGLAMLVENGWLMADKLNAGNAGRPSLRFTINPEALQKY
jgi:putative DNA primase/helicase